MYNNRNGVISDKIIPSYHYYVRRGSACVAACDIVTIQGSLVTRLTPTGSLAPHSLVTTTFWDRRALRHVTDNLPPITDGTPESQLLHSDTKHARHVTREYYQDTSWSTAAKLELFLNCGLITKSPGLVEA